MPRRLWRWLGHIEDALLAILFGLLLLIAVSQIGLRVFFNSGFEWAESISRVGVLWLAVLGALSATRERKHISIDALQRFLPDKTRKIVWAITQLAAAAVCFALAWFGWGMIQLEREVPSAFIAEIPSWWPMLIFPFGFGLMGLRILVHLFDPPNFEPDSPEQSQATT